MKDFFQSQHDRNAPVQIRYRQTNSACISMVDISRLATVQAGQKEKIVLSWLQDKEKHYLQQFRFQKRYNEWLSGRLATKCCLLHQLDPDMESRRASDFSILPDSHGRPILYSKVPGRHQEISISHSRQYAVAIAAYQVCGIDIQHISAQILKVSDRIATPTEYALAQRVAANDMETGLTILWSIKETLKKQLLPKQPGIFEAITVQHISPGPTAMNWQAKCTLAGDNTIHTVHISQLNQYILAWSQG